MVYGRLKTISEEVAEINNITIDEVTEAVTKYLNTENLCQVYVAPPGFEAPTI